MDAGEREGSGLGLRVRKEGSVDRPDKSERRMDNSSKTIIETSG